MASQVQNEETSLANDSIDGAKAETGLAERDSSSDSKAGSESKKGFFSRLSLRFKSSSRKKISADFLVDSDGAEKSKNETNGGLKLIETSSVVVPAAKPPVERGASVSTIDSNDPAFSKKEKKRWSLRRKSTKPKLLPSGATPPLESSNQSSATSSPSHSTTSLHSAKLQNDNASQKPNLSGSVTPGSSVSSTSILAGGASEEPGVHDADLKRQSMTESRSRPMSIIGDMGSPPPPPVAPRPESSLLTGDVNFKPSQNRNSVHHRHNSRDLIEPEEETELLDVEISTGRTFFPAVGVVQSYEEDAVYASVDEIRRIIAKSVTSSNKDDYISLEEIRKAVMAVPEFSVTIVSTEESPGEDVSGRVPDCTVHEDMYLSFSELRAALLPQSPQVTLEDTKAEKSASGGIVSNTALDLPSPMDNARKGSMSGSRLLFKGSSSSFMEQSKGHEVLNAILKRSLGASYQQLMAPSTPSTPSESADYSAAISTGLPGTTPAVKDPERVKLSFKFECDLCKVALTSAFYMKEGKSYCANDYKSKFGIRCGKCNMYIEGNAVAAVGKHFHEVCLSCSQCNSDIAKGENIVVSNNSIYCEPCGSKFTISASCKKCNESISGAAIKAMGGFWHPNCFACKECSTCLDGKFYAHKNDAYCPADYKRLFAKTCNACKNTIPAGKSLQVGEDCYFHLDCMICKICTKPVEGGQPVFVRNDQPCHCSCLKCFKCERQLDSGETIFTNEDGTQSFCATCAAGMS